jgi:hypothetical protein
MGEILGGLIVMVLFIAFIMWRAKKSPMNQTEWQKSQEHQYWAERNSQETEVVSSDNNDDGSDN